MSEKINIERIDYNEIKHLKSLISKERVTLENAENAQWYAIKENGEIVSFFCLVLNRTARFKSNYTVKEFRRRGYLGEFIKHAKNICISNGIKTMTAFCTPLSIGQHLRNGAKIMSKKGDIAFVKYELV